MAKELQAKYASGRQVYAMIFNSTGSVWNTALGVFQTYDTASVTDYDVALTEQGSASGIYMGNFPSTIAAGVYSIIAKEQLGASPAEADPTVAVGDLHWGGAATVPLSDLATSGQVGQFAPIRLARGVMLQNFLLDLVSSADHVTPFVSGVVSGQIVRDNGNWGALQSGAFTEVGNGCYRLGAFTSGDLNGNVAMVLFTANGISGGTSDPRRYTFVLQRVSGIQ